LQRPKPPLARLAITSRTDPGSVYFERVDGGLPEQASHVVTKLVPLLQSTGVPLHEIAVLYRGRGPLVTSLRALLTEEGTPFVVDRDDRLPNADVVVWAQRCAVWKLQGHAGGEQRFSELATMLAGWLRELGCDLSRTRERLYGVLSAEADGSSFLADWLPRLDEVGLSDAFRVARRLGDNKKAWAQLNAIAATELSALTLAEFAHGARPLNKLVLSNYHNAKGRQFRAVILPGLQDGLVPYARWNKYSGRLQTPSSLEEDRRLFYVGVTRAKETVFLVTSDYHETPWGDIVPTGPSRFVEEVRRRLADST